MPEFLRRRTAVSAAGAVIIFLFWTLPEWLGDVFPLFTDKTLPQWLAERRWPGMSHDLFQWLTLIIGVTLVGLFVAILFSTPRQRRKEPPKPSRGKLSPPPQNPISQQQPAAHLVKEDTSLRLFVREQIDPAWRNMMRTMDQVNDQLNKKGGAYHYYVRALRHFMALLRHSGTDLNEFLATRSSLSTKDFIDAQERLARLYERYQERMPWVRDLVWYTDSTIRTSDEYRNWREADENMRKALRDLLPVCPVLSQQISNLSSPSFWWWEKPPNLNESR